MGGMIAQTMAIARPERLLSLTSIMSTTGDRRAALKLRSGACSCAALRAAGTRTWSTSSGCSG